MAFFSADADPPPLLMVVEYLETSMSKDLLYKFPDNSAFDFDYTQSSIWSPLLPRSAPHRGGNDEVGLLENTKKIASRIKRKFTDAVINNVGGCTKMKKRKRRSFGFSPAAPPRRLSSPKAWTKVMKAAVKHFKKRRNTKNKKNPNLDIDISNFLAES